jgi:hypothetical protein
MTEGQAPQDRMAGTRASNQRAVTAVQRHFVPLRFPPRPKGRGSQRRNR